MPCQGGSCVRCDQPQRRCREAHERNVRTARGGVWTHVQVGAILHPFDPSVAVAVA